MMNQFIIDINADVGEGLANEAHLMPYLSSCNIACGGHAGDFESMKTVVKLAEQHNVKIGAHPSFPDKENFGRRFVEMSSADLYTSLKHQIRSLMTVLRNERLPLHHIKPHGALYNFAVKDEKIATVIIEVIKSIALSIKLYAPFNSVIANLAQQEHIPVTFEAFADRNYNEDLSLVSRDKKNAIITDSNLAFKHIYKIISEQKVMTIDGVEVALKANTFCMHGDNPEVLNILKNLTNKLHKKGIKIL